MPQLVQTALLSPPFSSLTYMLPGRFSGVEPGTRVLIPLGNSLRTAIVLGPCAEAPQGVQLKELLWPLERSPLLGPGYLDMAEHLARRLMLDAGRVLGQILPAGLRTPKVEYLVYDGPTPRRLSSAALKKLDDGGLDELAEQWAAGRMEVRETAREEATQEYCTVLKDPPWPVRPAATRQLALLEFLWDRGPTPRKLLTRELGSSCGAALKTLAKQGLVSIGPAPASAGALEDDFSERTGQGESCDSQGRTRPYDLTPEQKESLAVLRSRLDQDKPGAVLLHGITGSGKTAVYLELAATCLAKGRSVILLAPEVALACQLRRSVQDILPGLLDPGAWDLIFHHGYQPPPQREKNFRRAAESRKPVLAVGTRSALFLPLKDIGLIVLDEEHDASFKQDERVTYQAKEIAHFLAGRAGGLLLLGSATPDVKTFHASEQGVAPRLTLAKRVSDNPLPKVDLVDIRGQGATEQLLAPESLEALKQTVKAGEQAVIMLNRRGYAPLMYCTDCGATAGCANCDIGLTYHKNRERLVCHYCGQSLAFPQVCAKCGGSKWLPMGEGTERLQEMLAESLPSEAGVLRLDRDSTRRPGRLEQILRSFARGEARVLVGTQMLSKGHHFPEVTLVIAADGDLGLNFPDYRARERTFQLLTQVAGRAGRGQKPGRVLIQTRDPNQPCWRHVLGADYQAFFQEEIALRQKRMYPPFVKLGLVRLSFPLDWEPGPALLSETAKRLREAGMREGVVALGPAPAPLGLVRGRKRFHCLLKGQDWLAMRRVYAEVARLVPPRSKARMNLDLDPVDML